MDGRPNRRNKSCVNGLYTDPRPGYFYIQHLIKYTTTAIWNDCRSSTSWRRFLLSPMLQRKPLVFGNLIPEQTIRFFLEGHPP